MTPTVMSSPLRVDRARFYTIGGQRWPSVTTILDIIAKEYAEATAVFDFERAEGWLATAALVAAREADRARGSSQITRSWIGSPSAR